MVRAILQQTKIICFEESNSTSIYDTNYKQIRCILKEQFKDKTLIILSRNAETLIESDRVIVMKEGRLVEHSHPYKLLAK
jgi:ABC-type multidrug transport system fused ATPase/permease subunit